MKCPLNQNFLLDFLTWLPDGLQNFKIVLYSAGSNQIIEITDVLAVSFKLSIFSFYFLFGFKITEASHIFYTQTATRRFLVSVIKIFNQRELN